MNSKRIRYSLKFTVPIAIIIVAAIIMLSIKMQVKTVEVHFSSIEDKIEFKGIYFVDESVVYEGKTDKIKLNYKNGTKVSKGVLIGGEITAPEAGLMVLGLDGYENKYNINNIKEINLKEIETLINKRPSLSGIKILNNSLWFLCLSIPAEQEGVLKKYSEKEIKIGDRYYLTQIVDKFKNESGNFVILKMKDDIDITNLHRGLTGYIIKAKINGASLPASALAESGQDKGVFIEENGYAYFKKVKIVSEQKDNIIVTSDAASSRGLKEYDRVIVNSSGIKNGDKVK